MAETANKGTGAGIFSEEKPWRKSSQQLLPLKITSGDHSIYNIYPSFSSREAVYDGYASLAAEICEDSTVIIDGYGGVLWEMLREQLNEALVLKNKKVSWHPVDVCLKPEPDIQAMISPNLNGEDPVFGKKYNGHLIDFFDEDKIRSIGPDQTADISIIYGTGAALTGIKGRLLYADLPKNEIQYRMRASSIANIGAKSISEGPQMYKRFYFVDWPVLNKHKSQLLSAIDCIIDEQRVREITWMRGNAFRETLSKMLEQPFRARPWFEAGVWGGDWMKKHIPQLNSQERNYAWSFELISPENGIVIAGNGNLLEVSFDFLMYADPIKMLGKAATRFGTQFPIRFDFLDTCNGGNLSIQCHPTNSYIAENFGEDFTQDETYYILDCEPDANVYLGFQDTIDKEEFKKALVDAQALGIEMDVERYVRKLPAGKHDLFLVPNGTVHASGKNNLVLEISSTPYIFTFKMYDWLRLDLNGKKRPINIEHAFNNLCFERKGSYVSEQLVSHPVIEREWSTGRKLQLPTHKEHFYAVDRYEFTGSIQINTEGQCHICMLVEGEAVAVIANKNSAVFRYAETFVVPAATKNYELRQQGNKKAFVVVAYVKNECC